LKVSSLILALILLVSFPLEASAGQYGPRFTMAQTIVEGPWTGYRADIQVKPLTFAIWPGGWLSDETFVQSGFIKHGDSLAVFAWATNNTEAASFGLLPIVYKEVKPTPLSWVTFELVRMTASRWRFRYLDATGWHIQGYFYSRSTLDFSMWVSEYWAEGPAPFRKQVMRNVLLRDMSGRWSIPAEVNYSASAGQCKHERITSPKKGTLVFLTVENSCPSMHQHLW
jgi:hypothetical protein